MSRQVTASWTPVPGVEYGSRLGCLLGVALGLAAVNSAMGQFLRDGNFDALSSGKWPDCSRAAGAWGWPAHYLTPENVCERQADQMTIVPSSSFDPSREGRSLRLFVSGGSPTDNISLPNIFPRVIHEVPGQVVRVKFSVWATATGFSGGAVYVGGDHSNNGTGGYFNNRDRGPQMSWNSDGTITARVPSGTVVLLRDYPLEEWQTLRLDINLSADTYDVYWASPTHQMQRIGQGLGFRSGSQTRLDRFTIAHFADLTQNSEMYFDDIVVEYCYADCDQASGIGVLDVFDFLCFGNLFQQGSPYACQCDTSTGMNVCDIFDVLCFGAAYAAGCGN